MAKGILKSAAADDDDPTGDHRRNSRRLQWDEEKLRANALELEALEHNFPVDEPKTPYARAADSPERHGDSAEDGEERRGEGGESAGSGERKRKLSWTSSSEEGGSAACSGASDDDDDALDDLHALHKHSEEEEEAFRQHRKLHYDMHEAIVKGRALVDSDGDE